MNVLKTAKEFDTIRRQMDAQRGWNKENDEKELSCLSRSRDKQKEIDKQTAALAELEVDLRSGIRTHRKRTRRIARATIEELNGQRAKLMPEIPDKELTIYTRIAGIAAESRSRSSRMETARCATCGFPAQIQNLALIGRELVCCPSCGRILTAEKKRRAVP